MTNSTQISISNNTGLCEEYAIEIGGNNSVGEAISSNRLMDRIEEIAASVGFRHRFNANGLLAMTGSSEIWNLGFDQ